MQAEGEFFRVLNNSARMLELFDQLHQRSAFYLCLGATETSDIDGISAAGATPSLRRQTPAIDAEVLALGHCRSAEQLPISPKGVVSPVVITRACLRLANMAPQIVDCGTFVPPKTDLYQAGAIVAQSVSSGKALPLNTVFELFTRGFDYGIKEGAKHQTLILSECVPGGTTTALAVLIALGYEARNCLSGSVPDCNHDARWSVVKEGIERSSLDLSDANPFAILAAVGDPMQPFMTGMALAGCQNNSVILAGGSQMLAVYALCKALADEYNVQLDRARIGIITTKWVAFDQHAALLPLLEAMSAPLAASCPDFNHSKHAGLRAYEAGNVKEGVGAGAALSIGYQCADFDQDQLMNAIDQSYEELVGSRLSRR